MKKWYVEFPAYQYNEDVKALAAERGLKILDAKFQGDDKQCEDAPKLTIKGAAVEAPKAKTIKKAE